MDKITFKNGSQPAINDTNLNLLQTNIENAINKIKTEVLNLTFPIGSTYITQNNTNPSTILNFGTWERLKGKICLGLDENDTDFNSIGKTGGAKKHKHTTSVLGGNFVLNKAGCHYIAASSTDGVAAADYESSEASNLQPYEVVGYMWIRRK